MRFETIGIRQFGRIRDLETGPEPLSSLVAVAGPNEAGKSTFFRFLTSLLYGFLPANRDQNRDAPWSGDDAEGWARIVTDEGDALEVRRILRATPWGRLLQDGREEDIRNAALPQLGRLPRSVFRQVFALTLGEVAALEADDWTRVQDRLVSAMGARDLVSPRDVADKLEEEAGTLWRPNRRGNQQVRLLGAEIRRLESARDEAVERDREIRRLVEAIHRDRTDLEGLEAARQRIQALEERVGDLLPVHRQLTRIRELEAQAGNPADLTGLPPDPADRLSTWREKRQALATRIQDLQHLLQALRENERRANLLSRDLFGQAWDATVRKSVRGVSADTLRDRVRTSVDAHDALRIGEAGAMVASPPPAPSGGRHPRQVGLVTGLVLAGVGLIAGQAWLVGLGGAVAVLAALLGRRPTALAPAPPADSGIDQLRTVEAEAREALDRLLTRLPLGPEIAARPTLELPGQIQRLQELERDLAAQVESAAEVAPPVAFARDSSDGGGQLSLLGAFEIGRASEPVQDDQVETETEGAPQPATGDPVLDATVRLGAAQKSAQGELARLDSDLAALEARLAMLGGGDPDRGTQVAAERVTARRTARELAQDLVARHPDLTEVKARIAEAVEAGEEWTTDPQALTALQRRRVETTRRIEELGKALVSANQNLNRLQELPTADRLDGEVLELRCQRTELARKRDRLTLIARLVREADRRFRQERQPRVLARAGEYLGHVTDGRYRQILTGEDDGEEVFKLRGQGHPHPVSMGTGVSTATREQAYLALRLAAVEELDAGGERLPVFIDEVFVNWDARRRARGLDLMARIAASRQVFVFTCHSDVVTALESLGAHTVMMEGGRLRTLETT